MPTAGSQFRACYEASGYWFFPSVHQYRHSTLPSAERTYCKYCAQINPSPDPGTIHTDTDAYFAVSVLLEGEQNIVLPSADSDQTVIPKAISSSYCPLCYCYPTPSNAT